jgi:phosphatidylglycerophosphate synthase
LAERVRIVSAAHVPNIITSLRIFAVPVLLYLAWAGERQGFAWLLTAALASDIVDGLIARRFGLTSELGARLDSLADLLTFFAAGYGFWRFFPVVIADERAVIVVVIALWIGVSALGLLRYGRLASFHTLLTRVCAYALGIFLVVLFLWGFMPWLFWTAAALVFVSQAEEIALLFLLPRWTPNCRGLYWCLKSGERTG